MFTGGGNKAQKEAKLAALKEEKAIVLQCFIRKALARSKVRKRAMRLWRKVFDPSSKFYFWYNQYNGQSQWTLPKYVELFTNLDKSSTVKIQRIVRGFTHRMRAKKKAHGKYTRFYDSNVNKFYWMINQTQQTFWKASAWLIKQEIPMPPEDEMLLKSVQKIKQLEEQLLAKENEIKAVRLQRYEELEPQVYSI